MKKYYPIDFDTKGNAILGDAKSTPTSNSFIPTTWAPGGGSGDEGNGIMSISITPAIETTPALDSVFPIYWEDIPAEDITDGHFATKNITVTYSGELGSEYHITATPTANWQIQTGDGEYAEKGATAEIYGSPMDLSETPSFNVYAVTDWDDDDNYKKIEVFIQLES